MIAVCRFNRSDGYDDDDDDGDGYDDDGGDDDDAAGGYDDDDGGGGDDDDDDCDGSYQLKDRTMTRNVQSRASISPAAPQKPTRQND